MVTNIVFIPKAEGGVRPIGLLCLVAKIWSELRQPLGRDWEKAHRIERTHHDLREGWVDAQFDGGVLPHYGHE